MEFEALTKNHAIKLLNFELENKEWFESFIEARDRDFYSHAGVTKHIDSLTNQINFGTAFCGVLIKNNTIVARANLKNISNNTAYVGYRVGKSFTSQGIASYCLSHLIEIAQNKLNLNQLKAQVLDNNPASMRVLRKFGFQVISTTPNFLTINNQQLSCIEFGIKYA